MITAKAMPDTYLIYGQFSRDVVVETIDTTNNYFIFKTANGYEYVLFYEYTPGASDGDIVISFDYSLDNENYSPVVLYQRTVDATTQSFIDTGYKLEMKISPTIPKGFYVFSLPPVVSYCKVKVDGLVDGNIDFVISPSK